MSRPVGARPPLTEMGEPPFPPWKAHEPHPTTTSSLGLPPVSCLATRWSATAQPLPKMAVRTSDLPQPPPISHASYVKPAAGVCENQRERPLADVCLHPCPDGPCHHAADPVPQALRIAHTPQTVHTKWHTAHQPLTYLFTGFALAHAVCCGRCDGRATGSCEARAAAAAGGARPVRLACWMRVVLAGGTWPASGCSARLRSGWACSLLPNRLQLRIRPTSPIAPLGHCPRRCFLRQLPPVRPKLHKPAADVRTPAAAAVPAAHAGTTLQAPRQTSRLQWLLAGRARSPGASRTAAAAQRCLPLPRPRQQHHRLPCPTAASARPPVQSFAAQCLRAGHRTRAPARVCVRSQGGAPYTGWWRPQDKLMLGACN